MKRFTIFIPVIFATIFTTNHSLLASKRKDPSEHESPGKRRKTEDKGALEIKESKASATPNLLTIMIPDELLRAIFLTSIGRSEQTMITTLQSLSQVNKKFYSVLRTILAHDFHLPLTPVPLTPAFRLNQITVAGIMKNGDVSQVIHILFPLLTNPIDILNAYETAIETKQDAKTIKFDAKTIKFIEDAIIQPNLQYVHDSKLVRLFFSQIISNGFKHSFALVSKHVPQEIMEPTPGVSIFAGEGYIDSIFRTAIELKSINGVRMILNTPQLHEHLRLPEQIASAALGQASRNGDIDMLTFLHINREFQPFGNEAYWDALTFAMKNSQVEVIKFFVANERTKTYLTQPNAMYDAINSAIIAETETKQDVPVEILDILLTYYFTLPPTATSTTLEKDINNLAFRAINNFKTEHALYFLNNPQTQGLLTLATLNEGLMRIQDLTPATQARLQLNRVQEAIEAIIKAKQE